ncbi:thiamine phosphate synthase [Kiloniella laminariae]|uniref:thiamine phosphate synthase n=1 Tax=Kiloniella laminariae TaxID=454162 RepID=UPI000366887B|nr:thiamine phosphate synthase [Kiloniella laminariae]
MNSELYLLTPPELLTGKLALEDFLPCFNEALGGGKISCILLSGTTSSPDLLENIATRLCPLAQQRDIAFLLEDEYETALRLGCDGVHLNSAEDYKKARQHLGTESIVGVDCGVSRHDALLAGEAGADYIAFNNRRPLPEIDDPEVREFEENGPRGLELLTWWQTMMTPPCVSLEDVSADLARDHAEAGADFVAVQGAVWNHPAGPAKAIAELNEAIA